MPSKHVIAASRIARQASVLLRKKFKRTGIKVHHLKAHNEIVTAVDLASNKLITRELLKAFPTYDIVSEEAKKIDNPSEFAWYIDPLDGTTNYRYGISHYAICIGLYDGARSEIEAGVIAIPEQNEIYAVEKGWGARLNNKKIHVSNYDKIKGAMFMGCAGYSNEGRNYFQKIFIGLFEKGIRTRVISSAGAELTAVASGQADLTILTDTKAWDVLPGVLLIREAGGKVTNLFGKKWTLGDSTVVAANPVLHKKIMRVLEKIIS